MYLHYVNFQVGEKYHLVNPDHIVLIYSLLS